MPPIAAFGDSFRAFYSAAGEFLADLTGLAWGSLALGLAFHVLYLSVRTRAWFNILRAAYPDEPFRWRNIWAAQLTATGINSVIPARAGDVAKLFLAKQSIPHAHYPSLGASLLVESLFESLLGAALIAYALTQGVLPPLPDLPAAASLGLPGLIGNPELGVFVLTTVIVLALVATTLLAGRVRAFWARVRQGFRILSDRPRYLRQVALVQLSAVALRFGAFWFLLEAFRISASVETVLLVLAVQAIATLMPFAPGGAGAQQALLFIVLAGVATGSQVAAYSVGQQLFIALTNVALAFVALSVVFRTRDWRAIVRSGRTEQEAAEEVAARPA